MKYNAKLTVIYIFGTILPASFIFLNGFFADKDRASWNYANEDLVFQGALMISILSCLIIAIINYSQQKISFWYTLSITTAIGLGLFLYLGNSLSHFGF